MSLADMKSMVDTLPVTHRLDITNEGFTSGLLLAAFFVLLYRIPKIVSCVIILQLSGLSKI